MRKASLLKGVALAGAMVLAAAGVGRADPITVDGGWYGFCFGASGSGANAGCQNDAGGIAGNPFTFTALGNVEIKITDSFQIGDTFKVEIDGAPLVFTSAPGPVNSPNLTDPDASYAAGYYSTGSFTVGAGSHTINIYSDASPYGGGGAYIQVTSVPEPMTLALLGMGIVGLAAARRRR